MNIQRASCASCGAPVDVPADVERVSCPYCGTALVVQRGEGYLALIAAQEVRQALQGIGADTQWSIRESTQTTQLELRRLQLAQELSAAQMQLSSVQAEIRSLERQAPNRIVKRQIRELCAQETSLIARVRALQAGITPGGQDRQRSPQVPGTTATHGTMGQSLSKDWLITLLLCTFLGPFGIHRFYTGHVLIGIVQLLTMGAFGIWWLIDLTLILLNRYRDAHGYPLQNQNPRVGRGCASAILIFGVGVFGCGIVTSRSDALLGLTIILALLGAILAFTYAVTPNAAIWMPLKRVLPGRNKQQ